MTKGTAWPDEHSAILKSMIGEYSYADIAEIMNAKLGTSYSRSAVLGRAQRMGFCVPRQVGPSSEAIENRRQRERFKKQRRRDRRWAANPSLKEKYLRSQEKRANRKMMLAGGATKTSAQYRKHVERAPEMTKNELRAMLTLAVQNTAAMVTA